MSLTSLPPSANNTVTAFLQQRTSNNGGFNLFESDTEYIQNFMAPKLPPVVLSLLNDPNVVNTCLQNPAMQQLVQEMQSQLETTGTPPVLPPPPPISSQNLLEEVDSHSASTATIGHYDSEDELGSRQTYVGDEEQGWDDDDHYHDEKCFACGQRRGIAIKTQSSSSSEGAGSPPKFYKFPSIPTSPWVGIGGLLSLAIVIFVISVHNGVDMSLLLKYDNRIYRFYRIVYTFN